MSVHIRSYIESDYSQLRELYQDSSLYGGGFDENRDAATKLKKRIEADPDAILIAEQNGSIVGSVSLIEDGRVAWLFRFAVTRGTRESEIADSLLQAASMTLKNRGHKQMLVYTPVGDERLHTRYTNLGFTKGSDYTCFWKDI